MDNVNGRGPTPIEEAARRVRTVVEAPMSGIRYYIRRIGGTQTLRTTRDLPTAFMKKEEALEYVKGLEPDAYREYMDRVQEANQELVMLAVISPRLTRSDPPELGTIYVGDLGPDLDFLADKVLEYSRTKWAPPADIPPPDPSQEVSEEQFRGGDAPAPGDGGGVGAPPVTGGEPSE